METRDIKCECGEVLGTCTFEDEVSEEAWDKALSGYLCENCSP